MLVHVASVGFLVESAPLAHRYASAVPEGPASTTAPKLSTPMSHDTRGRRAMRRRHRRTQERNPRRTRRYHQGSRTERAHPDCLSVGDLLPPKAARMTTFHAGFFPDFHLGDSVVLVGADRDGMRIFQSAVRSAHEGGEGAFELHGVQHRVVQQGGAADIEFEWQTIVWRFDDAKLVEILDLIPSLIDKESPGGHQYVDCVHSPAETLILSVDEYVDGGPFAEFPQGLPVPH